MGMFYHLLLIIERKEQLNEESLKAIFRTIDHNICDPNYSVLYMALNMFVEVSYLEGIVISNTTKICKLLTEYYQANPNSKLIKCLTNQIDWETNT